MALSVFTAPARASKKRLKESRINPPPRADQGPNGRKDDCEWRLLVFWLWGRTVNREINDRKTAKTGTSLSLRDEAQRQDVEASETWANELRSAPASTIAEGKAAVQKKEDSLGDVSVSRIRQMHGARSSCGC